MTTATAEAAAGQIGRARYGSISQGRRRALFWSYFFLILFVIFFLTPPVYMFITSLTSGKKAPRNPWGSCALEWQSPSPPPVTNFLKDPVVTRGPYDYHLATPEELATGWDEVEEPAAKKPSTPAPATKKKD